MVINFAVILVLPKLRGKILSGEGTQVGLLSQRKELCNRLCSERKLYTTGYRDTLFRPLEIAEQNKNYFMFRIFCLTFYYLLSKVIYCGEIRNEICYVFIKGKLVVFEKVYLRQLGCMF